MQWGNLGANGMYPNFLKTGVLARKESILAIAGKPR